MGARIVIVAHRARFIFVKSKSKNRLCLALGFLPSQVPWRIVNRIRSRDNQRVDRPRAQIFRLAKDLSAGTIDTLVVAGANPVYDAPRDLAWQETQRKAKTVLRLGFYEDETGAVCDYHYPGTHYLESWGDARTFDGTLVPVQPLIEPLFGGMTELEFLARIGGLDQTRPYDIA